MSFYALPENVVSDNATHYQLIAVVYDVVNSLFRLRVQLGTAVDSEFTPKQVVILNLDPEEADLLGLASGSLENVQAIVAARSEPEPIQDGQVRVVGRRAAGIRTHAPSRLNANRERRQAERQRQAERPGRNG